MNRRLLLLIVGLWFLLGYVVGHRVGVRDHVASWHYQRGIQ